MPKNKAPITAINTETISFEIPRDDLTEASKVVADILSRFPHMNLRHWESDHGWAMAVFHAGDITVAVQEYLQPRFQGFQ